MTKPYSHSTIKYYDENCEKFVRKTRHVKPEMLYEPFVKLVPRNGRILDLGCGSGRDANYFYNLGFHVVAIDASREMVARTRDIFNGEVYQMRFDQMKFQEEFDGIWACASLLHVPHPALGWTIDICMSALKPGGWLYMSFKVDRGDKLHDSRKFTNLTKAEIIKLVAKYKFDSWYTADLRQNRKNENWLNALVQKAQS